MHKKIIVILGPTASGKSDLAIALAKKYGGEIISADSRQVYRGMDIGTGKVTKLEQKLVPHHLIDVANPKEEYNVSHFVADAGRMIEAIEKNGNVPIICGGTTFWIEALILGLPLPRVAPDKAFREKWGGRPVSELYSYLKRLDPERAQTIDRKNKVRLLRAIEIAKALGKVPVINREKLPDLSHYLFIGLNPPAPELNQKIRNRLKARMKQGMLEEVKKLHTSGISYERLEAFGLEYRALAIFLQGKFSMDQVEKTLPYDIIHYAKRQRSSLRRLEKQGLNIAWFENVEQACKEFKL